MPPLSVLVVRVLVGVVNSEARALHATQHQQGDRLIYNIPILSATPQKNRGDTFLVQGVLILGFPEVGSEPNDF